MALTAIGAMKEEALKGYYARVLHYYYEDDFRPENPVSITMNYLAPGPDSKATRGALMWALKTLTVQMITFDYYRPMAFVVTHRQNTVWTGLIEDRNQPTSLQNSTTAHTLAAKSSATPPSFVPVPINPNTVELKQLAPLNNDPHYEVNFEIFVLPLAQDGIFEAIMEFLLVLGKVDATAVRTQDRIFLRRTTAWIWLMEVDPPVQEHRFKQFHEVAILEAIARYYVQTHRYKEMTVTLKADGQMIARGCVTRAFRTREWCHGLFVVDAASSGGNNSGLISSQ
ncbi:MAG: hypothetical protein Q9202_007073 [Teloschistes flavicans]